METAWAYVLACLFGGSLAVLTTGYAPLMGAASDTMVLIGLVTLLFLYFLPAWVASRRGHPAKEGILILNLFLGWTFIGWVLAFAWSCSEPDRGQREWSREY